MSTHMPGFQSFFRFLHHFVLVKFATSSIKVNRYFSYFIISLFGFVGCGNHVEQVLKDVPPEERCKCPKKTCTVL